MVEVYHHKLLVYKSVQRDIEDLQQARSTNNIDYYQYFYCYYLRCCCCCLLLPPPLLLLMLCKGVIELPGDERANYHVPCEIN